MKTRRSRDTASNKVSLRGQISIFQTSRTAQWTGLLDFSEPHAVLERVPYLKMHTPPALEWLTRAFPQGLSFQPTLRD